MNCEHCQELLPARERGELPPGLEQQAAAHLRTCADCARAEAALCELTTLLDFDVVPSPGLRRQVLARLEREAATQRRPVAGFATWCAAGFARFWPSRPLGAFTYSLALVLCGMFGGQLLPGATGIGAMTTDSQYQLCPVPERPRADIL